MGKREEELKKEGWERKFTTEEPRLSEAVELYESLGYEVHIEPASSEDMNDECNVCIKDMPDRYKTIYTRFKE